MSDRKVCLACREPKPLTDFCRRSASRDGLQDYCKACTAERMREYRRVHPEKIKQRNHDHYVNHGDEVREQARKWHEEHPGAVMMRNRLYKAQRAGAGGKGITVAEWDQTLEQYGRTCLACGSTEHVTMDHVVPLSRGGRHEIANTQPLCASCNASKGTKTIDYRATGTEG